ncbi:MAG TPA: hypothetical protein VLH86_03590 [Patescibacteria group bacterium]|nr:hypothetical protein [Patescibacteria group bacterium]
MTDPVNTTPNFNWGGLTEYAGAEASPTISGEPAAARGAGYAAALGETGIGPVEGVAPVAPEAGWQVTSLVQAAEQRYGRNSAELLGSVKGLATNTATRLGDVNPRLETVQAELPAARRALTTVGRFAATCDVAEPVPEDIEHATVSLFSIGGAYEDVTRKLKNDYADQLGDTRTIRQSLEETGEEADRARTEIVEAAKRHEKMSPDGMYLADHEASLGVDQEQAVAGTRLAKTVEDTILSSSALEKLPEGSSISAAVQGLLGLLRTMGHEQVVREQLRAAYDKVVLSVTAAEQGGERVAVEVSQLQATLGQVEVVVDQLLATPLVAAFR